MFVVHCFFDKNILPVFNDVLKSQDMSEKPKILLVNLIIFREFLLPKITV